MIEVEAARLRKLNSLWRDQDVRREFERDSGLAPIMTGNSLEVEAQTQSGATSEYHSRFREWASNRIAYAEAWK